MRSLTQKQRIFILRNMEHATNFRGICGSEVLERLESLTLYFDWECKAWLLIERGSNPYRNDHENSISPFNLNISWILRITCSVRVSDLHLMTSVSSRFLKVVFCLKKSSAPKYRFNNGSGGIFNQGLQWIRLSIWVSYFKQIIDKMHKPAKGTQFNLYKATFQVLPLSYNIKSESV